MAGGSVDSGNCPSMKEMCANKGGEEAVVKALKANAESLAKNVKVQKIMGACVKRKFNDRTLSVIEDTL